jgi:4-diphosphocytidyl-2-C-methyl-D-erythritol kinase
MAGPRAATIRSLAKINLDLRVLGRLGDGYHELRTIFQTISLADTISIEFRAARRTRIEIAGNVDIPDNLILRAAGAVFERARAMGEVRFGLRKRIPMGAGLGGGSSNAAAVLLALPAIAGLRLTLEDLREIAAELGSDVPFFLMGGTAAGFGRGTDLVGLPDLPPMPGLVVAPGVHVSTAEAYRALGRAELAGREANPPLTIHGFDIDTSGFRDLVWSLGTHSGDWRQFCANDFEGAVFGRHPQLRSIQNTLQRLGARPALMTGSGSALFGLFETRDAAEGARKRMMSRRSGMDLFRISLISRRRYQAAWLRQLEGHVFQKLWPPQSRHVR